MNVQITSSNDSTIVTVEGRLDTMSAGTFEEKLLPLIETTKNMVINLAELDYISSTGLRVFLIAQKKIQQAGGKLSLCALKPSIREIFDIAGFSTIFAIFSDEEAALGS